VITLSQLYFVYVTEPVILRHSALSAS